MSIDSGEWIETWTGRRIFPMALRPEDVCLEDVAWALSNKCRYSGHCLFYSVAEHSLHLANWSQDKKHPPEVVFNFLMHDAAEAYLPDVPSTIKPLFPELSETEDRILKTIFKSLHIPFILDESEVKGRVKEADMRIRIDERIMIMPNSSRNWGSIYKALRPLGIKVKCWKPKVARDMFISRFKEINDEIIEARGLIPPNRDFKM